MATGTLSDDDLDVIKLYWQVQALKGQVQELERERNRTANLLWAVRHLLIRTLINVGVQEDFKRLSDVEIVVLYNHVTQQDYRFSRCPNAMELRCRPLSLQLTRDGDPVYCEDCGWSVAENFPPFLDQSS